MLKVDSSGMNRPPRNDIEAFVIATSAVFAG
jgi:hypothetical protein